MRIYLTGSFLMQYRAVGYSRFHYLLLVVVLYLKLQLHKAAKSNILQ